MTNEETVERIRALAGEIIAMTDRLSAPREPLVEAPDKPKANKPLKLEDVRAVLTQLASTKGADAAKALLKDFGAAKLTDIAAQDYPELLAKAQEMSQ